MAPNSNGALIAGNDQGPTKDGSVPMVGDGGASVRWYAPSTPEDVKAFADSIVVPPGAHLNVELGEAPNGSSDWLFRLSAMTGEATDVMTFGWTPIRRSPDGTRMEMERFAVQGHPKQAPAPREMTPEELWDRLEREAEQKAKDSIVQQLSREKAAEILAARAGGQQERRVFSATEVMGFSESSWLVKGFVPAQQIGILYGPSQSKKSFLSLDVVNTVASGLGSFHGRAVETQHGKALYLYGEGGAGVGRRIEGWEQERKVKTGAAFVPWVPYLGGGPDFDWLLKHVEQEKYDLIVVDTLSKAAMDQNLNYAHEWRPIFRGMDALAKAAGGTVLAVAHPNKGGDLTGSYQQFADADFVIEVAEDEGELQITARKFKDAETGKVMSLKVAEVALDDDGERKTLVLRSQAPLDELLAKPEAFSWRWEHAAIYAYMQEAAAAKGGVFTETDLINALAAAAKEAHDVKVPPRSTAQRRISDLVKHGYVTRKKDGNTNRYSWATGRTWPPRVMDATAQEAA